MKRDGVFIIALLGLAGCAQQPAEQANEAAAAPTANAASPDAAATPPPASDPPPGTKPSRVPAPEQTSTPPDWPPAPGTPGGLPDDRTPVDEGPIDPKGAQGAAQVVQRYGGLLESGDFARAYALWGDGGRASGMNRSAFAKAWANYAEIHAQVGAPGRVEGAAGSLYVDVPLQLYGTLKGSGARFNLIGPVTLRRVNDVPGATSEQLRWHISASGLKPRP